MNDPQQRLDTPDTQTDLTGIFDTDSPDGIKLPLSGRRKLSGSLLSSRYWYSRV